MKIYQRDVVFLAYATNSKIEEHPWIILSCNDAIIHEDLFTAVMMTNATYDDLYSFPLRNNMFNRALDSEGQARLHIIASFREKQVLRAPISRMKLLDFKRLLKQINSTIFLIDED